MDIFKVITDWITNNWGSFMIGTMSLGTVITTVIYTAKQWIASKAQTLKINGMWASAQESIKNLTELYHKERNEKLEGLEREQELKAEVVVQQATQNVMFDILLKLALSSKLDSDDKIAIVANVERLKTLKPDEQIKTIVEKTKETVSTINDVVEVVKDNPEQIAVDAIKNVGNLLDKYTKEA